LAANRVGSLPSSRKPSWPRGVDESMLAWITQNRLEKALKNL
jgi:hypothetical protein